MTFVTMTVDKVLDSILARTGERKLRILDIGCGYPESVFLMYETRKPFSYYGIDKISEKAAFLTQYCPECKADDPENNEPNRFLLQTFKNKGGSEKEFYLDFTFHYGTSLEEFLTRMPDYNFDLIILSNVLHKIEKGRVKLFRQLMNHLTPGGFVYVSVLNQTFLRKQDTPDYRFSQNEFDELKFGLEIEEEEASDEHFQFLGRCSQDNEKKNKLHFQL